MNTTQQIGKHLRDVYSGGNWTVSNYKEHLKDVSWQEATRQIDSLNSIATLVYHTGYYITVQLQVLRGEGLNAKDEYSFLLPPINSEKDWNQLLERTWSNAEQLASLIEQLPDSKLPEAFTDEKYGNYLRNFLGVIEHLHYHLGQIVLIKKLLRQ